MDGVRLEGTSDIRELKILGDWAYLRNFIEIAITPPGGETMHRSGYTLTIAERAGRKMGPGTGREFGGVNFVVDVVRVTEAKSDLPVTARA